MLLYTSVKLPLTPLARLESPVRTVPQGEVVLDKANSTFATGAASTPASDMLGIFSSLMGRDADVLGRALWKLPP